MRFLPRLKCICLTQTGWEHRIRVPAHVAPNRLKLLRQELREALTAGTEMFSDE